MEGVRADRVTWEWVAGFFDGEGTACLFLSGEKGTPQPYVEISNTSEGVIRAIHALAGCGRVSLPPKREGRRQMYHWGTSKKADVARVLESMLPYLVLKWRQAELLLEACGIMGYRNPEGMARKFELYRQLKALNGRIINDSSGSRGNAGGTVSDPIRG